MKIKISQNVRLNDAQLHEIAETVLQPPEQGWRAFVDAKRDEKPNVRTHAFRGKYGEYRYRVNLSWNLITLLQVR